MGAISRIKDVWGFFATDFNFRKHPGGASSQAQDYPGLEAEDLVHWYQSIHSDKLAWVMARLQSGCAIYPSKVLPRMEKLSLDFFQRYCELSKAAGMYVLVYTDGGDDIYAFRKHPEWFREYGFAFACLNAPFWDREFEAVREMLHIFPADGLFYDMVQFSGNCSCESCQAAYREFYGEKMPRRYDHTHFRSRGEKQDILRFRLDTWKRWVRRATQAGREIVPGIEVCVNQQWLRPDGLPYELMDQFDWYFCEFGMAEWVGEIMRAWGGDKHMLCGNVLNPKQAAHLLGRRISPEAYDVFQDYRTGKMASVENRRVKPIKQVLGEVRKCESFVKDAVVVPHATVLYGASGNSYFHLMTAPEGWSVGTEGTYSQVVAACVRDATRMNLSCCTVEVAERLTREMLDRYEIIFAPDLGCLGEPLSSLLHDWVTRGGILFASGVFALVDKQGEIGADYVDRGLLGVRKIEGPLDTFSDVTHYRDGDGINEMQDPAALDDVILCAATTAEPIAYGNVGADDNVPLIWRNKVGKGIVFYLSGRVGRRIEEDPEKSGAALRACLQAVMFPHIRKVPFRTSTEYPVEIWLNEQPGEKRLVMHIVAFEKPLAGQHISVRADLIAEDEMEIVYPASKKATICGKRADGYVEFALPELQGQVIAILKKG